MTKALRCIALCLIAAAPIVGAACSSDDESDGEQHNDSHEGACAEIEEACAPKDDGSDQAVADCHDLGHDTPEAECEAQEDACITLCNSK